MDVVIFFPYMLYKSVYNTDIAFRPSRVSHTEEGVNLAVTWWNIVNPDPKSWHLIGPDTIFIQKEKAPEWKAIAIRDEFDEKWSRMKSCQ